MKLKICLLLLLAALPAGAQITNVFIGNYDNDPTRDTPRIGWNKLNNNDNWFDRANTTNIARINTLTTNLAGISNGTSFVRQGSPASFSSATNVQFFQTNLNLSISTASNFWSLTPTGLLSSITYAAATHKFLFGTNGALLVDGQQLSTTNWVGQNFLLSSLLQQTNGFITLLDLVVVDFNNTNKLASTNWTGANFVLQSAVQNTNGLAGTNWVGANFYLQSNPSGYIATIPADATNGFLAKTNGTASNLTNLTVNAINTVTNYAITDGTNYWSVIGSTNGLFTNFTFNVKTEKWSLFGDGNGLTNYNYNSLINLPIIPATNGFITLADLVTPDFNNTNKLASTNWVGANFLLSTLLQTTNGFITLADLVTPGFNNTNKLASTNWVGANFLLSSLLQQTNGFITQPDAIAAVNTNTIFRSGGTNSLVFQNGYGTNVTFVQTNFYVFGNTSTNGMFLSTTGAVMSLVQGGVTNTFIRHTNGNLYVNGYLLMTNGIALNGANLTAGSVPDAALASTFLKVLAVGMTNTFIITNDPRSLNLTGVVQLTNTGNIISGNGGGLTNLATILNMVYLTSPTTIGNTNQFVRCSGTFPVTMLSAAGIVGQFFDIKNAGTGIITVQTTASQLMDTYTNIQLLANDEITLISNGTNYLIK